MRGDGQRRHARADGETQRLETVYWEQDDVEEKACESGISAEKKEEELDASVLGISGSISTNQLDWALDSAAGG